MNGKIVSCQSLLIDPSFSEKLLIDNSQRGTQSVCNRRPQMPTFQPGHVEAAEEMIKWQSKSGRSPILKRLATLWGGLIAASTGASPAKWQALED